MKAKIIADVFESYAKYSDKKDENVTKEILEEIAEMAKSLSLNEYMFQLTNRLYYDIQDRKMDYTIYAKIEILLSYFYVLREENKND